MRYAASSARGMLREVFDPDRHIGAASLDRWVVELRLAGAVVDLRTEDTLDALGLDDQISTSRARSVWSTAQELGDLLWRHAAAAGRKTPTVLYRSRTTPQHNTNAAFFGHSVAEIVGARRLRDLPGLLETAITADDFTADL